MQSIESLALAEARRVIEAAEAKAQEIKSPSNIAVVDASGNLVAHVRNGAWIGSVDIAINKAFTARAFNIATKDLAKIASRARSSSSNHGRVMVFAGGIPLRHGNVIVGAVGVSGATAIRIKALRRQGLPVFKHSKKNQIRSKKGRDATSSGGANVPYCGAPPEPGALSSRWNPAYFWCELRRRYLAGAESRPANAGAVAAHCVLCRLGGNVRSTSVAAVRSLRLLVCGAYFAAYDSRLDRCAPGRCRLPLHQHSGVARRG